MSHCVVVIPVYATGNERLNYLSQCLTSLTRQQTPFVGIIVDDGSPIGKNIEDLVRTQNDDRLRYIRREKHVTDAHSSSAAVNYGIAHLKTRELLKRDEHIDSFCYLHADDMLAQNSLQFRRDALAQYPVIHGGIAHINNKNQVTSVRSPRESTSLKAYPHTMMWDWDALTKIEEHNLTKYGHSVFDPTLDASEDMDLTLSTAELYPYFHPVNELTYIYREAGAERISAVKSIKELRQSHNKVLEKHGLEPEDVSNARILQRIIGAKKKKFKNSLRQMLHLNPTINDPLLR